MNYKHDINTVKLLWKWGRVEVIIYQGFEGDYYLLLQDLGFYDLTLGV
jgi:hypothetical protein